MSHEFDAKGSTGATQDGTGNLLLPARTIPIPKSISPEAQSVLADPRSHQPRAKWPSPADKMAWKRFVFEQDKNIASMFAALPPFPGNIDSRNVGAARLFELIPDEIPVQKRDRAILYAHGGGYVMGGGELAVKMAQSFAAQVRTKVCVVDYRMPPDHPYPAAVDDMLAVYRELLTQHVPGKMAFIGTSAGAGLAAASILRLRDLGLPLPGAAVLHTPENDLTESGDSFETNQYIDHVLVQRITESILLYADGHDLRDAYLSPLFGDFSKGFPPTLLTSGTRDLFLSNTVRMHRALRNAGIEADLVVFEAMPHSGFGGAPEDAELLQVHCEFIDDVFGRR